MTRVECIETAMLLKYPWNPVEYDVVVGQCAYSSSIMINWNLSRLTSYTCELIPRYLQVPSTCTYAYVHAMPTSA